MPTHLAPTYVVPRTPTPPNRPGNTHVGNAGERPHPAPTASPPRGSVPLR